MKKRILVVAVVLLFMFVMVACGGNNLNEENNANQSNAIHENENNGAEANGANDENNVAEDSLETAYPLTITDTTGEKITFEAAPERIASTSPAETEILFALGLGDKVVGVSDFDTYPEEVNTKERVGGIVDPNMEVLIALEADLIITGLSVSKEAVEQARSLDLKLFRPDPQTVQDVLDNILLIGEITNHQAEAHALVEQMEADIEYVTSTVASLSEDEKKRVYLEFAPGWTVGHGEFMHELLELAGGVNIAADVHSWHEINEELIIEADPQVILYGAAIEIDGNPLRDVIASRSGWDTLTAVKEDRIIGMDDDILTRPGPRITDGLKLMAEAIYPELFGE